MGDQNSAVADNEWLYRRSHKNYIDPETGAIRPRAFYPRRSNPKTRDDDKDGISFFREKFLATPLDLISHLKPEKQSEQYIFSLPAKMILDAGLTIAPSPKDDLPAGHCTIVEINTTSFEQDEDAFFQEFELFILKMCEEGAQNFQVKAGQDVR